jgi:glutamine synthetase
MIPCSFVSWTGDALDTKTPLLRASSALSREATRLLRLLGDDRAESVQSTMGAEQEFFIVDRALYQARPDLVFCGRALFGAKPPKGQEMEDHYFAAMPPRILAYIEEVEHELWKLGIPARSRHNEVAPGQHEMAPIFEFSNLAADHNMVSMDIMKEVAIRHGLVCLLHEKPFAGVNGSGKHNNWSMCTNYGLNLLEPTASPKDNLIFQVFLLATIRAVDLHADLLRASIAVPGNDWRLGANEAPPAIMSVYLGSVLADLVRWIASGCPSDAIGTPGRSGSSMGSTLKLGERLQSFSRDRTDRNRTSPFAFTGNKFEFRAVGSSQSVGSITTILNTIAADSIRTFANDLEAAHKASPNASIRELAQKLMGEIAVKHNRILFDGNGYSKEWVEEATRRGLPNMRECVAALEPFNSKKNLELFKSLEVLSYEETNARRNIYFEYYSKTINIEAQVSANVATTQLIPAAVAHQKNQAVAIKSLRDAGLTEEAFAAQKAELDKVTGHVSALIKAVQALQKAIDESHHHHSDVHQHAIFMRDHVKPAIASVREHADFLESQVEDNLWPLPKYSDLLFLK